MWVRSRNCSCLVTWFCYQLIAKPGNKIAAVSWPDPCKFYNIPPHRNGKTDRRKPFLCIMKNRDLFILNIVKTMSADDLQGRNCIYRLVSNIRRTLVSNKIVDQSDVVGASLLALLQIHLHSRLNTWLDWIGHRQLQDATRNILSLGIYSKSKFHWLVLRSPIDKNSTSL